MATRGDYTSFAISCLYRMGGKGGKGNPENRIGFSLETYGGKIINT